MAEIDKQIEQARRKPLTTENLNYIGDLYIKKGDTQRAIMYFYEAADKLHFAQKDKKIAIYKKIIKISPSAEKAYLEIIGILSKMGLVMEEKKYLHLLGTIYEQQGERDKAEELLNKVRELDPHVSIPGSFFHAPPPDELQGQEKTDRDENLPKDETVNIVEELPEPQHEQCPAAAEEEEGPQPKLIEASIEEMAEEGSGSKVQQRGGPLDGQKSISTFPVKYLLFLVPAITLAIAAALFFVTGRSRQKPAPVLISPVSSVQGDYSLTVTKLEDINEVAGVLRKEEMNNRHFAVVTIKAVKGCLPESFVSSPHAMISLLDAKGIPVASNTPEGLKTAVRVIYKTGVCAAEKGAVFVRLVLCMENDLHFSGLSIQGLQQGGAPLVLKWGTK